MIESGPGLAELDRRIIKHLCLISSGVYGSSFMELGCPEALTLRVK